MCLLERSKTLGSASNMKIFKVNCLGREASYIDIGVS